MFYFLNTMDNRHGAHNFLKKIDGDRLALSSGFYDLYELFWT
jgi:hypothetical protein